MHNNSVTLPNYLLYMYVYMWYEYQSSSSFDKRVLLKLSFTTSDPIFNKRKKKKNDYSIWLAELVNRIHIWSYLYLFYLSA